MQELNVGDAAPDFTLECYCAGGSSQVTLSNMRNKLVILAFYPKDDTPGCTKEMCAFRDDFSQFAEAGIAIYGISKDTMKAHEKFANKYSFEQLPLLSDSEGTVSEAFGVGTRFPKRTLFVIDQSGNIAKIHEGMPKNDELLSFCRSLLA